MKKKIIIPSLVALLACSCTLNPLSTSSSEESSNSSSIEESTSSVHSSSNEKESSSISSNESSSLEESSSSEQPSTSEPSLLDDFTLSWSDEFEGTALNTAYWEPQIGDGTNYNVYRWGNNEQQYYKSENAVVKDGHLHIVAKKERTTIHADENDVIYEYTSARLRTTGRVTTTYGYIEARIKLPAGTGLWPAFWMLPEDSFEGKWWPTNGEIDIMEAKGRLVNRFGATIHTGNSNGQDYYRNKDYTFTSGQDDITNFHRYGVEWSTAGFAFYIDEFKFFEVTPAQYQGTNPLYSSSETAPFDRPFHLLLNLAVGGNYDSNRVPDDSFTEAEMLVDYVRIYKRKQ